MLKLQQTIPGETWSTFDWNSITYDGCIVDLGCYLWDWSTYWFGMKRVIGVDPFEKTIPNGAELFSGVLGDKDCKVGMDKPDGHEIFGTINLSSFENGEYEMLSWKTFCKKFEIDNVSILLLI